MNVCKSELMRNEIASVVSTVDKKTHSTWHTTDISFAEFTLIVNVDCECGTLLFCSGCNSFSSVEPSWL